MSPAPLLLASRSPRRAALLTEAQIPFVPGPSPDVDETPPCDAAGVRLPPEAIVRALAIRKADAAHARAPDHRVLTADTLVFRDGAPLGKPRDAEEARAMLRSLADRWHEVWTGVALLGPSQEAPAEAATAAVCTRVRFRALSEAEIEAYVATGEPLDKAGGYGIQAGAAAFVAELEGPLDNVIGLPLDAVRRLLAGSEAESA